MSSTFGSTLGLAALLVALISTGRTLSSEQVGDSSEHRQPARLPTGVILVKGAWPSASDSVTAVPEAGTVSHSIYINAYFDLTYPLAPGWIQKYAGPPPSETGYYVLAQIEPAGTETRTTRGSILIAAQDLFFTLAPAANALELINYTKETLEPDYKVERPPTPVSIGNHQFVRFDYYSPVAGLHWCVLATQIRCHVVQFVFTSRDTNLVERLVQNMNKMKLPAGASPVLGTGGVDAPVCIKDYARGENVIKRVDPIFRERRFNAIPVRIVIDENGKVKHIHFLSAFSDQAKSVGEALSQWRFKPYLRNGRPVELETGVVFGHVPRTSTSSTNEPANE